MIIAQPKLWTHSTTPRKSSVSPSQLKNSDLSARSYSRSRNDIKKNKRGENASYPSFSSSSLIPLMFYRTQGDAPLSFSSPTPKFLNLMQRQKRLFFGNSTARTIQNFQTQLNSQPNNVALFSQLLRELNRSKDYSKVRALVESGKYSLQDARVMNEYYKAMANLDALDQVLRANTNGIIGQQQHVQVPHLDFSHPQPGAFPNPPLYGYQQQSYDQPAYQQQHYHHQQQGQHQQQQQQQQQQQSTGSTGGSSTVATVPPHFAFNDGQPITVKIQASTYEVASRWFGGLISLAILALIGYSIYSMKYEKKPASPAASSSSSSSSAFPITPAHSSVKDIDVRFSDVKGCDEVKKEVEEIVEYLKNPDKFHQLGAKLPKGVLLSGPPGTGKTLLARAIAGEAGVKFLYCSGSSFDELFVGVGPKRVRQLFEEANKAGQCIIFIDEIDAVGAKRSKFSLSASKESTLNQLLTEMDGFNQTKGVIVIGATNLPDSLDPALTRPGRFDKLVHVPLPDVKGRKDIIELYFQKTKIGPDVDSKVLARGTPGFSGAELANLINLAAIKATVQNKKHIDMHTLEEARDDVIVGIKRIQEQTFEDRRLTAYHEGGHALVSLLTDGSRPLHKATIIGRGSALGITWSLGGDEVSRTKKETLAAIAQAMGGRAAEELIFGEGDVTTGASSDIMGATRLATAMVTQWGMSERVGKVYYNVSEGLNGGVKISDSEMNVISSEIKDIIDERYAYAKRVLKENEDALHRIADGLLKYETLSGEEIKRLASGYSLDRDL